MKIEQRNENTLDKCDANNMYGAFQLKYICIIVGKILNIVAFMALKSCNLNSKVLPLKLN